jgi:hypothetical protein
MYCTVPHRIQRHKTYNTSFKLSSGRTLFLFSFVYTQLGLPMKELKHTTSDGNSQKSVGLVGFLGFYRNQKPNSRTYNFVEVSGHNFESSQQGVKQRCRLSWLTNSALVYEPKCGVSTNEYSCTQEPK